MKEIYKDIPNYKGLYQVSNFGNVKSLQRTAYHYKGGFRIIKERILSNGLSSSKYYTVALFNNGKRKTFQVHQLVAMVFLNHTPNGKETVINHINFNRLDNKLENLEIITMRENCNQKHLKSTSKYTGVYKCNGKWRSVINIMSENIHLGYFTEKKASDVYEKAVKNIHLYNGNKIEFRNLIQPD